MPRSLLPSPHLIQRRPAALEAIRRHRYEFGVSPSFAELAERIGVEKTHVGALVRSLAKRGEIEWTPRAARGMRLPRELANYATSALLLELQDRGMLISVRPVGSDPLSGWLDALWHAADTKPIEAPKV